MKIERIKNSGLSQNIQWALQTKSWATHVLGTLGCLFLYLLFFDMNTGVQLTILTYNVTTFIFFHAIMGDPFDHRFKSCTFWEQMCEQVNNPRSLMFMSLYPCFLFALGSRLVEWNIVMFYLCVFSLCIVIIPKFGFMHMKRIFGIGAP